jgi:hypothetical protein
MLFNNSIIKVINLTQRHELNTNQITNFEFINMDMDNKVINDNIFDGNHFNSELLIASIAFTHYNLWKKLIIDNLDYYIILNDDIKLGDRLKENIESLHNIFIDNDINIFESGYTINKIGAIKLLQYIKHNGFKYDLYKMIEIVGNKNLVINNIKDKLVEMKIDIISIKPMNMNDLSLKYKLDKNREYGHDYIPIYEKLFDNIKYNVKNILEIGIGCLERDQMTHMKHLNYRTNLLKTLHQWNSRS